jgi:hypothetical protein
MRPSTRVLRSALRTLAQDEGHGCGTKGVLILSKRPSGSASKDAQRGSNRLFMPIALLCIAPIAAGCTAAATAALNIAGTIAVKAFDLDTAIIDDIKARRDAAADPNMSGGPGAALGSLPERSPK